MLVAVSASSRNESRVSPGSASPAQTQAAQTVSAHPSKEPQGLILGCGRPASTQARRIVRASAASSPRCSWA